MKTEICNNILKIVLITRQLLNILNDITNLFVVIFIFFLVATNFVFPVYGRSGLVIMYNSNK